MASFSQYDTQNGSNSLGGGPMPTSSRFNDMASFVTDTSSITNPVEFGFSYSDEDDDANDDVSFADSATSALTGLTGWTSANGGGGGGGRGGAGGGAASTMEAISELGESEANFLPLAHSKSYKSTYTEKSAYTEITEEGGAGEEVSEMESQKISAISFDMYGSVETSIGEIEVPRSTSYKSRGSSSRKGGNNRAPLSVLPPPEGKAVQFRSPCNASIKSKGSGGRPVSPTSSVQSSSSTNSKKRAPVPPLRDPNMDDAEEDQMWEEDCNYDINPTLMFLVLESHDWKESIALLDGKGLENKNDAWNLGTLFGGVGKRKEESKPKEDNPLTKKAQKELRSQARTWIVRRERTGVLRWRMLPLHAAMAFNAPFDVVLRLYHLYPGAVRCRNDQGMLPLHHCFKYGNEDKVMELLLDVFPEALTVVDDKGRLPMACTPKDGSDNERRSNIMTLFCNFQLELAKKEMEKQGGMVAAGVDSLANVQAKDAASAKKHMPQQTIDPVTPPKMSPGVGGGTLGAAPRYTTNTDYNQMTYNSIKPPAKNTSSKMKIEVPQATDKQRQAAPPATPLSPKEEDSDRYALLREDSENNPSVGNAGGRALGGLSPIREDEEDQEESLAKKALKCELLALRESKKKKGLRKLFGKKKVYT